MDTLKGTRVVPEGEVQMVQKTCKKYGKEFQVEALHLAGQSEKPVTQVARELGLRQNQIY